MNKDLRSKCHEAPITPRMDKDGNTETHYYTCDECKLHCGVRGVPGRTPRLKEFKAEIRAINNTFYDKEAKEYDYDAGFEYYLKLGKS